MEIQVIKKTKFPFVEMSFQMYKDGYKNITNIDISPSAIKMMLHQQEKNQTDMKCREKNKKLKN